MFDSAAEALKYIVDNDIAMVDLKVAGITGQWMHISVPARRFTADYFETGVGYDGSSGSGFTSVEAGDVVALPEAETGFVDPFWDEPTLSFICRTVTADTREPFAIDPRTVALRAEAYMRSTGIADECWMAPEYEFHVFDSMDLVNDPYETVISIRSSETQPEGLSPAIGTKRGYMRIPPAEHLHNLRSEITLELGKLGVPVRYHHHEVGAPGQCEIELNLEPLIKAADHAMLVKYVVKNIARRHGKIATFMPKPVFGEAGNGMHVHQRLTLKGKPLFFDTQRKNYADLSDTALHYVGGLLLHGQALAGVTNPSTNSFKRLVEGYEAPVNLFFSLANRSAAIRVPRYANTPNEKRIEYRPPDSTCNIYAALAAMLMAGLDGIESKVDLDRNHFGPYDVDISRQSAEFRSKIAPLPRSLYDALDALEQDHEFLLKGEVFAKSFIENWIDSKRRNEAFIVATRPHPYEYELYLDA